MRWFKVDFTVSGSDYAFACEVTCIPHSDCKWWIAQSEAWSERGKAHSNVWVAIANLFDANDAEITAMREIDRAGNRV